ncbi:MAG TPA: hypothetical protein VLB68_31200 [Pyrinomonadaceae bacterium]|nr:hypothetical protein [Pyrinomonadaceae bacterium]
MSPAGEEHGSITGRLTVLLGSYILQNKLGLIYCAETGFVADRSKKRTLKILLPSGERTVLTKANEIVDDSVVTGFRLNVSEIFD